MQTIQCSTSESITTYRVFNRRAIEIGQIMDSRCWKADVTGTSNCELGECMVLRLETSYQNSMSSLRERFKNRFYGWVVSDFKRGGPHTAHPLSLERFGTLVRRHVPVNCYCGVNM